MVKTHPSLQFSYPLPYGAVPNAVGVRFSVFSRTATAMRLLLYNHTRDHEPTTVIDFDPDNDRWGGVWSMLVPDAAVGQLYHFQADGPFEPEAGHRFDGRARLIDPYARALAGEFLKASDGIVRPPKCVVVDDHFDWQGDRHLKCDLSESVIYEMHVKGFTQSRTSGVEHPGTYLGVIEKIPYLVSLGVTAIELMPVNEFPTNHFFGGSSDRPYYWGYDPMAFFAPHRGYATSDSPGAQVHEFKQMVRALHAAGIEVILDVVFNHTAEGNELGPTFGFKGLENSVYYMLEEGSGAYRNYSGCGNTVNSNHPIVRELIFHCLRHWVLNYHIDGFRFDLASVLSRDRSGELVPNTPIIEVISEDPLLADTKIIAEAWDAAGAYQVGSFAHLRWSEWNGRFRDDVRRFWRGDPGTLGPIATRIAGSSDLYQPSGRRPYHSINFVTSHDGFTLNDLVSYSRKHNESNGENNADGENNNFSDNHGVEGPTRRRGVLHARSQQIRNMLSTLLLSMGVPMLLSGDECRRTQRGNNNAYCQDGPLSWFDWRLIDRHDDLLRFTQALIAFRKNHSIVRRKEFLHGNSGHDGALPDVLWCGHDGNVIDWSNRQLSLQYMLNATGDESTRDENRRHLLVCLHAGPNSQAFCLPPVAREIQWTLFIDTAAISPDDVYPEFNGPRLDTRRCFELVGKSLRCYVSLPLQ